MSDHFIINVGESGLKQQTANKTCSKFMKSICVILEELPKYKVSICQLIARAELTTVADEVSNQL